MALVTAAAPATPLRAAPAFVDDADADADAAAAAPFDNALLLAAASEFSFSSQSSNSSSHSLVVSSALVAPGPALPPPPLPPPTPPLPGESAVMAIATSGSLLLTGLYAVSSLLLEEEEPKQLKHASKKAPCADESCVKDQSNAQADLSLQLLERSPAAHSAAVAAIASLTMDSSRRRPVGAWVSKA